MEDHESHSDQGWAPDDFPAKPGNYLQGNYLRCVAEVRGSWQGCTYVFGLSPSIFKSASTVYFKFALSDVQIGSFEHNLTTDLLNHLVFLQKVFMKEVNEVIQKVSGNEEKDSKQFTLFMF